MKNNERLIQFFDIQIKGKTRSQDIKFDLMAPRTLNELMKEFICLRELNMARHKLSDGSKQEFILADLQEYDNYWVLLINIVDADAAHIVTNKMGGSDIDRQVITLDDNQGLESSAHVIIYKEKDVANKHLVLYEKSQNLSFAKAISFLNKLSKVTAKQFLNSYQIPHPSGLENQLINIYCSIDYFGHPSDEFYEELEAGVLTGIRLTSEMDRVLGYDANAHKDLIGHEIKMNTSKLSIIASRGNLGHLKKAIKYADSLKSPFVRVQFKDSTGVGHSATLSTDTEQLVAGDKYIKKRKIEGFGNSLQTAFPIIHQGIIDKMVALIT